jgi:hypothetical protein
MAVTSYVGRRKVSLFIRLIPRPFTDGYTSHDNPDCAYAKGNGGSPLSMEGDGFGDGDVAGDGGGDGYGDGQPYGIVDGNGFGNGNGELLKVGFTA